jgi:hypothetical protein
MVRPSVLRPPQQHVSVRTSLVVGLVQGECAVGAGLGDRRIWTAAPILAPCAHMGRRSPRLLITDAWAN